MFNKFVEKDRQWFKSCNGLDITQTSRSISFCSHAIEQEGVYIINDASQHPTFQNNPVVVNQPYIKFYAGKPIYCPKGYKIGTLCIIDRTPREFSLSDRKTLTDLTKWVESELKILSLTQKLAISNKKLKEASFQKEKLSAMITHDLVNSVGPIISLCDLLENDTSLSDKAKKWISVIKTSADNLEKLSKNVFNVYKISDSKIEKTHFDGGEFINICLDQFKTTIKRSINITNKIHANKGQLQKVIYNLISNAIDFTHDGGEIKLELKEQDSNHVFKIKNTGVEITKEYKDKIFEPFFTISTYKRNGLGLSICKEIVEAHGGTIKLDTKYKKGNCFVFTIPFS